MACCQRTPSWSGTTGFSIFGWLHEEVAESYDAEVGRPSIDPEVTLRLMLAGFLLGLVHDRRLMREAQVKLAIRWFCGYGLHETLPDHSSLTRIRQRLRRVARRHDPSGPGRSLVGVPRSPPAATSRHLISGRWSRPVIPADAPPRPQPRSSTAC